MIIGYPYRYFAERSTIVRRAIVWLSSEKWSGIGFTCLLFTAVAGYFHQRYCFAALLIGHEICDINDGYVYQNEEHGKANGYGLYIDHILDSIGAAFVALGEVFLLNSTQFLCVFGLVCWYLIAIHSWLYKIVKISSGEVDGAYYAVVVSKERRLALNVDDLAVIMIVIAFSRSVTVLYLTDAALLLIFLAKVVRTVSELRSSRWRALGASICSLSVPRK